LSKLVLTEIWIYPIKSLPGIQTLGGTVLQKGMQGDRRFMLIDQENKFITQRNLPHLSQFELAMDESSIQVSTKGLEKADSISIPRQVDIRNSVTAAIWTDHVEVVEVNSECSQWFSDQLKVNCRLVYFPEPNQRRIDSNYVREDYHTSLSDGYPYLIIGRASLHDLSSRVGQEMVMNRFRPNLVFEGGSPYEEDTWKNFKIGDVSFTGVKPCGRCVMTTIDPETGVKGDEPLRTLSTYRKIDNKILFGQNVIAHNEGRINEGDEIVLL
jgi:uncharacterized protein YcbX